MQGAARVFPRTNNENPNPGKAELYEHRRELRNCKKDEESQHLRPTDCFLSFPLSGQCNAKREKMREIGNKS